MSQGLATQAGNTHLSHQSFIYITAAMMQLLAKLERNGTQSVPLSPAGQRGQRGEGDWCRDKVLRTRQPQTSSFCPPCQTSPQCSSSSHRHHGDPSPGEGWLCWCEWCWGKNPPGPGPTPAHPWKPPWQLEEPSSTHAIHLGNCTLLFQHHGCQRGKY